MGKTTTFSRERSAGLRKVGRFRAMFRYFRDPSASRIGKTFVLLALVYVIMPVDLIPDVPLVGWLDDLGVMGLAAAWLTRVAARYRELPEQGTEVERDLLSAT